MGTPPRVPEDDPSQPTGFFARLKRWWSGGESSSAAAHEPGASEPAAPPPVKSKPATDKRWQPVGEALYLGAGRLFLHGDEGWNCDYLFDIVEDGEGRQVRILLPETPIAAWESEHQQRMTEAKRLALVKVALEEALKGRTASATVIEDAIRAVAPEPGTNGNG